MLMFFVLRLNIKIYFDNTMVNKEQAICLSYSSWLENLKRSNYKLKCVFSLIVFSDFGQLVILQILETNTSMSHQEQMQFTELSQNSRWPDREETV